MAGEAREPGTGRRRGWRGGGGPGSDESSDPLLPPTRGIAHAPWCHGGRGRAVACSGDVGSAGGGSAAGGGGGRRMRRRRKSGPCCSC